MLLLPNVLDPEVPWEPFLPISVKEAVLSLQGLIAESYKEGRRYLRQFMSPEAAAQMPLLLLSEHTRSLNELLEPLSRGEVWGLISDGGLPSIADPGSELVFAARQKGIVIKAFPGPSSIFYALQLSGCIGQRFAFHGYLPKEEKERRSKILELEARSRKDQASQLWIEVPYRSKHMLETLLSALHPETLLCVGVSLTTPNERIASQKVKHYRKTPFPLEKELAIFILQAY